MTQEKTFSEKVRKHIIFYGRVQGVGFRYSACYFARPLGLTGWVKNLWDGTVEMEVQGSDAKIAELLKELQDRPFIEIEHMDIKTLPIINENGFRYEYYE